MVSRYKKMGEQLGKKISDPGAHMPHVVVGIIRKFRTKKHDEKMVDAKLGKSPLSYDNPYPSSWNATE